MKIPVIALSSLLWLLAVASPGEAGLGYTILDPEGRLVGQSSLRGFCPEADNLPGPSCTNAPVTCTDGGTFLVCSRVGFLIRLTMCTSESNPHEGHPFDWSVTAGSLPPSLAMCAPPNPTTPQGTSTAYVGGDITIAPSPPAHNGLYFGELTADYCGQFTIHASCTCPISGDHLACESDFDAVMRVIDFGAVPVPVITTTTLPDATVGASYTETVVALGGTGNYTFNVTGGAFPPGLNLSAAGVITGIPTLDGLYVFEVTASEDPADPQLTNHPAPCAQAPPGAAYSDAATLSIRVLLPSAVPSPDGIIRLALEPARPNPSTGAITFGFSLPEAGDVRLEVFDLAGRRIALLLDGQRPAGRQQIVWGAVDSRGTPVANGVFAARLSWGREVRNRKLVIQR